MAKVMIPQEVRKAVAENNTKRRMGKRGFLKLAETQLKGRKAVAFYGNHYRAKAEDFFLDDGRHIKILPVKVLRKDPQEEGKTIKCYTGYYVAFDVNQIELNSEIQLEAPAKKTRMVVGTRAWQVAEMCRKLGLKSIKVVGI